MKHSDVTISMITYSAVEESKRTLSAILETREGAQLILTANGNDKIANHFEKISTQREGIRVIINSTNQGFISPSNLAFSLCETPLMVLINDDAIPSPDWLDKMKADLAPEDVVIAGPGGRWLDDSFVGHRMSPRWPYPDFIEGSCMMVKVDVLRKEKQPLFWPELKIAYCEDAELALRMGELGYSFRVSDFTLTHKPGTTTRTVPQLHAEMKNNFKLCMNKWQNYLKTRRFD